MFQYLKTTVGGKGTPEYIRTTALSPFTVLLQRKYNPLLPCWYFMSAQYCLIYTYKYSINTYYTTYILHDCVSNKLSLYFTRVIFSSVFFYYTLRIVWRPPNSKLSLKASTSLSKSMFSCLLFQVTISGFMRV